MQGHETKFKRILATFIVLQLLWLSFALIYVLFIAGYSEFSVPWGFEFSIVWITVGIAALDILERIFVMRFKHANRVIVKKKSAFKDSSELHQKDDPKGAVIVTVIVLVAILVPIFTYLTVPNDPRITGLFGNWAFVFWVSYVAFIVWKIEWCRECYMEIR